MTGSDVVSQAIEGVGGTIALAPTGSPAIRTSTHDAVQPQDDPAQPQDDPAQPHDDPAQPDAEPAQPQRDAASQRAWEVAAQVVDPEVPVLTIEDLGVLRAVRVTAEERGEVVHVTLTPTYSGCPAIDQMRDDVVLQLTAAGYRDVRVRLVLSPAWSTDWMTEAGRRRLAGFGIAPPTGHAPHVDGPVPVRLAVRCPRCGSLDTRELSRFGSTACKALSVCDACLEPFDVFKVH